MKCNKKLLESYIKEAILSELKVSKDWGSMYSNLWQSIKDRSKSLFSFEKKGEEEGNFRSSVKTLDVSAEINNTLEEIETFYDKKINALARSNIKREAMEIYKKYKKKGSTDQDAINKTMKFLQLRISRMSV